MNIFHFAAMTAAALVATSASAADIAGPRVEAVIGWDQVSLSGIGNRSGFMYGLGLGYDFAIGETVSLGVDGEIAGSTGSLNVTDGFDFYNVSAGRDLYVGARITGKVAENVAVYAKGGYSNARISLKTNDPVFGNLSDNGDGFRLGAGAQYLLGGGAYIGAEYRYTNYEGDFSRNQIVATLGYRF